MNKFSQAAPTVTFRGIKPSRKYFKFVKFAKVSSLKLSVDQCMMLTFKIMYRKTMVYAIKVCYKWNTHSISIQVKTAKSVNKLQKEWKIHAKFTPPSWKCFKFWRSLFYNKIWLMILLVIHLLQVWNLYGQRMLMDYRWGVVAVWGESFWQVNF